MTGVQTCALPILSLLGSLVPVPFILLFFNRIFKWMKKYEIFRNINDFINKKIAKNSDKMIRYREIGLIIFIGIPLPTTGLWTGSAIAAFLKLDFMKSLICTILGGTISGILITIMCVAFPWLLGL